MIGKPRRGHNDGGTARGRGNALLTAIVQAEGMTVPVIVPVPVPLGLLCLCLALAGCNAPGLGFSGLPAVEVTQGESRFALRRRGDEVEAVRISREVLPRFDRVALSAARAAERTYGCRARAPTGDPSVVRMTLDCG